VVENRCMAVNGVTPRVMRVPRPVVVPGIASPTSSELIPIVVLILGGILTALSLGTSWVHLAYQLPRMHAVIDTTVGLISVLLAYLVYGRVQVKHRQRDLVLAFALGLSAIVNLFSAITQGLTSAPLGRFAVWTPALGRLLVALLFVAAAFAKDEPLRRPIRNGSFTVWIAAVFGALVLGVASVSHHLPWSMELQNSPHRTPRPLFIGPWLLLVVQALVLIAYLLAGWGFGHERADHDDLMTWLASSCMLFGLASLDYLVFPSIFSDWIYVGDILRLAGVLLLFVGAAREISGYWRHRTAMEERRRLAHDLHDGVAQELAYIASVARQLEHDVGNRRSRRLADAAQHALDESRLVISTLAGAGNPALQISTTARDAARRYDLNLLLDLPPGTIIEAPVLEAILRIVREAINNAGRHANARTVRVQMVVDDTIVLTVADDGDGFDATRDHGGFGLVSMRERAAALGGSLTITSSAGRGTTVTVTIP
jgi:signal transduction histidine kinase